MRHDKPTLRCGAVGDSLGRLVEIGLKEKAKMNRKAFLGLAALLFAPGSFAQSAQPQVAAQPPMHAKPQGPMGCKLVGTVRGTKLWAGECIDAAATLRGVETTAETTPPALPTQAGAAIPPGQTR
jgi:hypothetical protein